MLSQPAALAPVQHFRSRHLSAPRVDDRPRLVGWSSLHRARRQSLTSSVVATGTASPVPRARWEARKTLTLRCMSAVYLCDRDHHLAPPCGRAKRAIGTPSVVCQPARRTWPSRLRALSGLNAPAISHTVLTSEPPPLCVSTDLRSAPRLAFQCRFALRLVGRCSARCVGPTSAFSLLRTSTRAS
jgi:hypothetical protein